MKLPNKINTYKESVISKFPAVLEPLRTQDIPPDRLYISVKSKVEDIGEYMEILDCLYALGAIDLDTDRGVLVYVNRNTV